MKPIAKVVNSKRELPEGRCGQGELLQGSVCRLGRASSLQGEAAERCWCQHAPSQTPCKAAATEPGALHTPQTLHKQCWGGLLCKHTLGGRKRFWGTKLAGGQVAVSWLTAVLGRKLQDAASWGAVGAKMINLSPCGGDLFQALFVIAVVSSQQPTKCHLVQLLSICSGPCRAQAVVVLELFAGDRATEELDGCPGCVPGAYRTAGEPEIACIYLTHHQNKVESSSWKRCPSPCANPAGTGG